MQAHVRQDSQTSGRVEPTTNLRTCSTSHSNSWDASVATSLIPLSSSSSARWNVGVEQLDYRPVRLDRLRRLARHVVVGDSPRGTTTLERIRWLERAHGANHPLADSGAAGLDD